MPEATVAACLQILTRLREDVLLERVLVEEGRVVLAHVQRDGGVGGVDRREVLEEEVRK